MKIVAIDDKTQLNIGEQTFKGKTYFDIRKFWMDKAGDWKPGKGVTFPVDMLPTVISALEEESI